MTCVGLSSCIIIIIIIVILIIIIIVIIIFIVIVIKSCFPICTRFHSFSTDSFFFFRGCSLFIACSFSVVEIQAILSVRYLQLKGNFLTHTFSI